MDAQLREAHSLTSMLGTRITSNLPLTHKGLHQEMNRGKETALREPCYCLMCDLISWGQAGLELTLPCNHREDACVSALPLVSFPPVGICRNSRWVQCCYEAKAQQPLGWDRKDSYPFSHELGTFSPLHPILYTHCIHSVCLIHLLIEPTVCLSYIHVYLNVLSSISRLVILHISGYWCSAKWWCFPHDNRTC